MAYPVGELLYSTLDTSALPVGIASVVSISKYNKPATDDTYDDGSGVYEQHHVDAKYCIVFAMTNGTKITWSYTASATRDTAYTAILTNYGFTIGTI